MINFNRWFKNIDSVEHWILGTPVAAGAFLQFDEFKHIAYIQNEALLTLVNDDKVLLSLNGSTMLSKADSLVLLGQIRSDKQIAVVVDESTVLQQISSLAPLFNTSLRIVLEALVQTAITGGSAIKLYAGSGETIGGPAFTRMSLGRLVGGPPATVEFIVVAQRQSGGGTTTIRLYNLDDATELAILNFTEDVPTIKRDSFTIPSAEKIVEVQGKRTAGAGMLFSAEVR